MTVQPDPATVAAPDANPQQAATNAATQANDHTPDPPVTAPAPQETAPTSSEPGMKELRDMVAGLATTVETLSATVTKASNPDTHPGKKRPWTHWGSRSEGDSE